MGVFANDDMNNDDQSLGVFGLDPTTSASSPNDFIWTPTNRVRIGPVQRRECQSPGVLSLRDPAEYQAGAGDNTLEIEVSVNDGGADSSTILITVEIFSD